MAVIDTDTTTYYEGVHMSRPVRFSHCIRVAVVLYVLSAACSGQGIRVLDGATLAPVPHAVVSAGMWAGETDADGRATLQGLAPTDSLSVHHVAYQTMRLQVADLSGTDGRILLIERLLDVGEVVVSASRWEQERGDVPRRVTVIPAREIVAMNPQTTADLLSSTGEVFVQKSQMGGGSPVLRGFEANRVLLAVDGVRMNNAIYRAGHLQNVILLDAGILDNAEILYGPGSVQYGSDALGGVMDFHTRALQTGGEGSAMSGTAFVRGASANVERTGHADVSVEGPALAGLLSVTASRFGDLRTGAVRSSDYPDWGKRPFHVVRENSVDVVQANDDVNEQIPTAYDQVNLLGKLRFDPASSLSLEYALHLSLSSDIPRYDRLTDTSGGKPVYADWRYGPQDWMMNSLTARWLEPTALFDDVRLITAWQQVDETRINRRLNGKTETHNNEHVDMVTVNADLVKTAGASVTVYYGAELVFNDVQSEAFKQDMLTSAHTPAATRYPDGGSTMNTWAAYGTVTCEPVTQLVLSGGVRYSHTALDAQFVDTTFYHFPFYRIESSNSALTWSAGAVFTASHVWRFTANLATGFRAPNVDDVSRVYGSVPGSVVMPNENLGPEYALTGEVGVVATPVEALRISAAGFATDLSDAIVLGPSTYMGQDSILYDGVVSAVTANLNAGTAVLRGGTIDVLADICSLLSIGSTLTYTYGHNTTTDVPLDHIPPLFGQTRVIVHAERFRGEVSARYAGWKRIEDYNPLGEDNQQYATPDGTPPWFTLNALASYQFTPLLQLSLKLENMLDTHYRQFASGVSAPGRNVVAAIRATW
jgi:hemoglobin/transferrin/lactoferrin receptor protein